MTTLNKLSGRTRSIWFGVIALGALLLAAGAYLAPAEFFPAYLIAYVFWLGITLGCFIILMIYYLAGGPWGRVLQRILEAAAQTSPLMAVLVVPILLGLPVLYPWARPATVAADALLQMKSAYLNVPFFLLRTVLYMLIWNALIRRALQWSNALDQETTEGSLRRMRTFGAVTLAIFAVTVTFAGIDYLMSLEPHWFSTIYSAMVAVGGLLTSMSFAVFVLLLLHRRDPLGALTTPQTLNDIGNLLIAFVMLWAYLNYSQFLSIWAGNLNEEISWYLRRSQGGWEWVALLAIVANFVIPFSLLMVRGIKRRMLLLGALGGWMIVARAVDVFWLLKPAFAPAAGVSALDVIAILTLGSVWLALFRYRLGQRPLVARFERSGVAATMPHGQRV